MSIKTLFVLGASDPEMAAIEQLLIEAHIDYAYAHGPDGRRVFPGNAYQATGFRFPSESEGVSHHGESSWEEVTHLVECATNDHFEHHVHIDHHRPGDPGFGRGPEEFLSASSIGQVIAALARLGRLPESWARVGGATEDMAGVVPPIDILLTAAADHCLAHAYGGECPGVDPDALMTWRAESRAAFQKRPVADVLADVECSRAILRAAVQPQHAWDHDWSRSVCDWCVDTPEYADLREGGPYAELPEASAREGIPFLGQSTDRDGRVKIVLQSAPPELIKRFLAGEIVPGLVDYYGDPARGFAGAYIA